MIIPVSTYRLQLNASFPFKEVADLLSYLHELGITTIYGSPFFAATAGSMHGYDVCDSQVLNEEIGTIEQLQQINGEMRKRNMTWLQDVVPNHMVYAMTNQRLADVLERGNFSQYYNWFDIDWQLPDPGLYGKLMVPFLGKPLAGCLADNEIKLELCPGGFIIKYGSQSFPLSISTYDTIIAVPVNGKSPQEVKELLEQLFTAAIRDPSLIHWKEIKSSVIHSFLANEKNVLVVNQLLETINSNRQLLQTILRQQYYQLSWWLDANRVINYRRFFAVNELIATNMANEEVFYEYHQFLKSLYEQKLIHGLRIDHIDGLLEPGIYLNRLRHLFGDDCYIIVEKILEQQEKLPARWPVQGTTGYDFTSQISWLLTNTKGAKELVAYYHSLFPEQNDYQKITFEKKWHFLQTYMGGEWDNLVRSLYALQLVPGTIKPDAMKQALGVFMSCLPVYRLYPEEQSPEPHSLEMIGQAIEEAGQKEPALQKELCCLYSVWQVEENDPEINNRRLVFQKRLMQFTGPLMAKGVEDTTFYVYNALLGHNEVGDTPQISNYSVNQFHQWILQRQQEYPFTLNATSSHDTKRGEDGRIRVNALTWFPQYWQQQVEYWRVINEKYKLIVNEQPAPGLQDEYFIYQSLIAGFPADGKVTEEYITRLKAYFIKSVREAKLYTNWQTPDETYEEAGCGFIENILSSRHDFLNSFLPFFESTLICADVFSLTQVLIKIAAPGVPDIYQGSELWNTSYVDPDNRSPVDFVTRKKYLQELKALEKNGIAGVLKYISGKRREGLEKLYVTWKALQCRNRMASLFLLGNYIPLYASVDCGIIAFTRQYENQWALVAAPVSDTILSAKGKEALANVHLLRPANSPVSWRNEFTGETISVENSLPLSTVCSDLPVALLTGETK
ncbi:malto-oligosyltrehalose synthase [Niastella caeni]|uniref:Malto-oligosyltrehalose synthase n=1 Tax=Niastella caeni TaxID=2569763 RepID=A0A4S8HWV2_9BACT|nr:malto-oligosyltrehalose synthase [Niastella caeni]THU40208.1 malto-oligosyltrehalose synthase [Niastella caeni]